MPYFRVKKWKDYPINPTDGLAALEAARADLEAALHIIQTQIWEIAKSEGSSAGIRARMECRHYGRPFGTGRLCTHYNAPCVGSYPDASIFPQDNDCFEPKND